LYVLKAIVF